MSSFNYRAGLGSVGQYQMSGIPYATASLRIPKFTGTEFVEVAFPSVTRWVTVINDATGSNKPLRVGFSESGVMGGRNTLSLERSYFVLNNGESFTGEWRLKSLFLIGVSSIKHDSSGDLLPITVTGIGIPTTASVIAGLTGIGTGSLQGNWTGSAGV